jgi:hypothetical protein
MISLDIAKSVFQAQGEDASGRVVFQKHLATALNRPFAGSIVPTLYWRLAAVANDFARRRASG